MARIQVLQKARRREPPPTGARAEGERNAARSLATCDLNTDRAEEILSTL